MKLEIKRETLSPILSEEDWDDRPSHHYNEQTEDWDAVTNFGFKVKCGCYLPDHGRDLDILALSLHLKQV